MPTIKEKLLGDFDVALSNVNSLIMSGTSAQVEAGMSVLSAIENDLRTLEERDVFSRCVDTREAIVKHRFPVVSHKKVSENGRLVRIERSTKLVQVDLKKFCEYRQLPLEWYYELQALNKRLTLRVAVSLDLKPQEVKEIDNSYNMNKLAEAISLGETPTSNSQCCKHLQRILDLLCPGAGRVNNKDLNYVLGGYTKRSNKAALRLVCANHRTLLSLFGDVAFNVCTGVGYGLEYKRKPVSQVVSEEATKKAGSPAPTVPLELPEEVSEELPEEVSADVTDATVSAEA